MLPTRTPHRHTPTLAVIDPRGLNVRTVAYCRDDSENTAEARISHQSWTPAGHPWRTGDPRLGPDKVNLTCVSSLSGQQLLSDSVDAGWKLQLHTDAGITQRTWDGRGTSTRFVHDGLLRIIEVAQASAQGADAVVERFDYAGADPAFASHNQCGRLLRHDDPAGSEHVVGYALGGGVSLQRRHFLISLDHPDWPEDVAARDLLLEDTGFSSASQFNAVGQPIQCSDAVGNRHLFTHDLAGLQKAVALFNAATGQTRQLISAIDYNALGQVTCETAGNGVVSRAGHDPANGRLLTLRSSRPSGPLLQDLHYSHDAVGNLVAIEDRALPVRYFRNQRIEPVNRYRYDSLYQLIEASGWEQDNADHGPHLPDLQPAPIDPARLLNYRQTYRYDAAGNLTELRHFGARQFTQTLNVATDSNRAVTEAPTGAISIDSAFDANGNLLQLQPGQTLLWNPRNQLEQLSIVSRKDAASDYERYIQDGSGRRLRKVRQQVVGGRVVRSEVRYLPGLELHRNGSDDDVLRVVLCTAGRARVQVLHWPKAPPPGIENNQCRYQLRDHLGSSCLELDAAVALLTHEVYYPFGATACWAARTADNAGCKRRRYSGKEREASGLYYYGLRYYAPWLMRWINPDPAGYGDGLNLYRMVGNNPLSYRDEQGTQKVPADILIADALEGADIGSGWFEELRWDAASRAFQTTRSVYSRGMQAMNATPDWSMSDEGSAIAIFQDRDNLPRLFVNTFMRHMGIQPGMGLPLFAGRIRSGNDGGVVFDNHSGHYKPLANAATVEALLGQLAPGARNVRYEPIKQSSDFDSAVRLSVASPEEYVDLVNTLKGGHEKVIGYLKDSGLWERVRQTYADTHGINLLFEAHDQGISPSEVEQRRVLAALPPAKPLVQRRNNRVAVPPPTRPTAVSTRKASGWRVLFKNCVGR
ncbi:RHS repeat-associated core domain-containing protein [Pseudomonas sp. Irchel 3E13]|uniref:RHS repeat-associated core domain-containing protein n=1 Tax=Pseudomonas sp. Irchel 3E13 TaxID=2008975 RepID=UPI000BA36987|nr:RHS repeat-associated core domain-containing protein [Pseudomonas sp. Irchel 3E13]